MELDSERLRDLEALHVALQEKLSRTKQSITAEKLRLVREILGLEIGSIVLDTKGKYYRVCEIDTHWDKPWLCGNPLKKDGTYGTAVRNLYSDWIFNGVSG